MIAPDPTRARHAWAVSLLLASTLCGCAGQGSRREPPLPFHVAVIPVSAEAVGGEADTGFALAIDSARASRSVVESLDRDCFTRATLLRYPEGVTPEDFERLSAAERAAHWIEASEAAGADLLLACDLRYSPALRSGQNEKFWMNLPLFLLGGPACYFVDDVSYKGEARLNGDLIDLSAIRADQATLEDRRGQVLHLEARFQEASLDFLDRAGGNVGLFAASIAVPAGLLSRESRGAERKVSAAVADELARDLARAVRDGSREILVADRLAGFHLDPRYTLDLEGSMVHFQGEAVLRRAEQERMEAYSVRVGGRFASGEFGPGTPDVEGSTRHTRYVRFPFRADLPVEAGADRLTVELTAAGSRPGVRTFTIPLPGKASVAPQP